MHPKAAPRPATYEDLCQVPEHLVAELIGGELVTSPRPASRHALAASALGAVIGGPFGFDRGGPGGWIILDEPELHLGGNVLVPDLAGWRRERLPEVPDAPYFTLAPDWICEILSPSTGARDRAIKLTLYSRAGVGHAWLVDPALRTLEIYRRQGDGFWLLLGTSVDGEKVRAEPFEAIELELAVLWGGAR